MAADHQTHLDDLLAKAVNAMSYQYHRQGLKISCPEEIAFKKGWISSEKVFELSQKFIKSDYGKYLMNLINHQS